MKEPPSEVFLPIKLFYFFIAIDALTSSESMLGYLATNLASEVQYPATLQYLKNFNINHLAIFLMIFNFIVPWLCLIYTNARVIRILNFLLFFFTKGVIFSALRFNHACWPSLWALLFFSVPSHLDKNMKGNLVGLYSYRGAIIAVTSFYWLSAVWKIVEGVASGFIFKSDYAANTIAMYLLSHGKTSLLGAFFVENQTLSYIGFLLIIFLQLSSICCIFSERYLRIWPILIFIFHAISIFVVQVNFFLAGIVAAVICFYAPKEVVIFKNCTKISTNKRPY